MSAAMHTAKAVQLHPTTLPDLAASLDLAEGAIADAAKRAASSVQRLANLWLRQATPDASILKTLRRIAQQHRVMLPSKAGFKQQLNRMGDPGWWRRALRLRLRAVELNEIQRGAVHKKAAPYVSAKAMRRFERNRKNLASLLESMEAVNQVTGQVCPLMDLIDVSQANPAHRRRAMMARIKGIETHSKALGHVALFLTITCPSRMHPRHVTGAPNERYDGTSPRTAQAYVGRLWNSLTRYCAHQGMAPYGLRVVEPHHDACPHWHVLVFIDPEHAQAFTSAARAYALADSPNEPGAQERRFTVEHIDPAKGSAVGYVAKYVSKSIDGEGVKGDDETGDSGADASRRIVAWARTWGIRQFQFFGVPPITPTRELYRVDGDGLPGAGLREAHQACKANDYAAWLTACQVHGLSFKVSYRERPSTRYADETAKAIEGLSITGGGLGGLLELVTRTESWQIQPRQKARDAEQGAQAGQAAGFPWTRFNNSASIDFKGFFEGGRGAPKEQSMPHPAIKDLTAEQAELMARAKLMRSLGFQASADRLMRRAWGCEASINALAMQALEGGQRPTPAQTNNTKEARRGA